MMKTLDFYYNGIAKFFKKMIKRLTVYDVGVIKFICFTIGLIFASWFPNFTKKFKMLFLLFGIILVIPVVAKAFKICNEVFKCKW